MPTKCQEEALPSRSGLLSALVSLDFFGRAGLEKLATKDIFRTWNFFGTHPVVRREQLVQPQFLQFLNGGWRQVRHRPETSGLGEELGQHLLAPEFIGRVLDDLALGRKQPG